VPPVELDVDGDVLACEDEFGSGDAGLERGGASDDDVSAGEHSFEFVEGGAVAL
jgi:hypothetical protein